MPDHPFESTPVPTRRPRKEQSRRSPERPIEDLTADELRMMIMELDGGIAELNHRLEEERSLAPPAVSGEQLLDLESAALGVPAERRSSRRGESGQIPGKVLESQLSALIQRKAACVMRLHTLEQGNRA